MQQKDYKKYKVIETEGKRIWDFTEAVFWNTRKKLIAWILRSMLVLRHIWGNIIRFEIRSPSAGAVQSLPVHTSAVFLS
jgi:hypothetical protein